MYGWWLILIVACGRGEAPTTPSPEAPATPAEPAPPLEAHAPAEAGEEAADPAGDDDASEPAQVAHTMAARHILIGYAGAPASKATRTHDEARALAEATWAEIQAGADFATLARERSEDASSARYGGFLGAFAPGAMVPEFERGLLALQVGETSRPVESPYGFHIIRREEFLERHFAHIFIARLPDGTVAQPRTPDETHRRAAEAEAQLEAGARFADVARRYSDGKAAVWGGDIGLIQRGSYPADIDGPLFELRVGQHTGIIDSPLGSHIFYRIE